MQEIALQVLSSDWREFNQFSRVCYGYRIKLWLFDLRNCIWLC